MPGAAITRSTAAEVPVERTVVEPLSEPTARYHVEPLLLTCQMTESVRVAVAAVTLTRAESVFFSYESTKTAGRATVLPATSVLKLPEVVPVARTRLARTAMVFLLVLPAQVVRTETTKRLSASVQSASTDQMTFPVSP